MTSLSNWHIGWMMRNNVVGQTKKAKNTLNMILGVFNNTFLSIYYIHIIHLLTVRAIGRKKRHFNLDRIILWTLHCFSMIDIFKILNLNFASERGRVVFQWQYRGFLTLRKSFDIERCRSVLAPLLTLLPTVNAPSFTTWHRRRAFSSAQFLYLTLVAMGTWKIVDKLATFRHLRFRGLTFSGSVT